MESDNAEIDMEIEALKTMFCALETLTEEGKARALAYFVARYKTDPNLTRAQGRIW